MKRHLNSLLQRKRAEFESDNVPRSMSTHAASAPTVLHVKDGYDWLALIRDAARDCQTAQ